MRTVLRNGASRRRGNKKSEPLLDPASHLILADEALLMPALQGIQMEQVCQEPRSIGCRLNQLARLLHFAQAREDEQTCFDFDSGGQAQRSPRSMACQSSQAGSRST
jgi:hypothetical protein